MNDVLCIYYSRTGNTKKAMKYIAMELDAELVELRDDARRDGFWGWLRCGRDAVRRTTDPIHPVETSRPLSEYRLVIIGTPVWAGRCSSVVRGFLKERGGEISAAAYLATRRSLRRSEEVFEQMDLYTPCGHAAAGSLLPGSVGYDFWREEFLRQVREYLN